jgi:hypothetical protein
VWEIQPVAALDDLAQRIKSYEKQGSDRFTDRTVLQHSTSQLLISLLN